MESEAATRQTFKRELESALQMNNRKSIIKVLKQYENYFLSTNLSKKDRLLIMKAKHELKFLLMKESMQMNNE